MGILDGPPGDSIIVEGESEAKRYRALRTFYVALANIATTPVDVFVGPSDSAAAGAYAGTFPKKYVSVMQAKLRQGVQPTGVKGGAGYYPAGASPFLQGDGWLSGATGTVTTNTTDGLGRVSLDFGVASQLTVYFRGTSLDMLFKQTAGAGSYRVTLDGGAPGSVVSAAGSTAHLKTSIASGLTTGTHVVVIDFTVATVTVEGFMAYDGDETKGLRVWSGAHSGYGAAQFVANTTWQQSLANIPNCKLVVLPIGSNDWYAGATPAVSVTNIESIVTDLETRFGTDVSIVLVSYYDRPYVGTPALEWDQWREQVYPVIANNHDNMVWLAFDDIFGPLLSNTDDRGGLTTALPGDYVHPTPAGHALIGEKLADFILPDGIKSSVYNGTLDANKPVSTPQATADLVSAYGGMNIVDGGTFAGGAFIFGPLYPCVYQVIISGNTTLSVGNMPPVLAGRAAHHYIQITQDATGSRTITHGVGFKFRRGTAPTLQTAGGSVDLLHYYWDGDFWWVENETYQFTKSDVGLANVDNTSDVNKPVSTAQAAADLLASDSGDRGVVVATINNFSGATSLAAFSPILGKIFNVNLIGNATFNITGIPAVPAGKGGSFYVRYNQDATGSRTLTLTGFKRPGGAFALSTAANASDLIRFFYDGTNWWAIPVALNGS